MSLLQKMNKNSSTTFKNAWSKGNIGGSISSVLGGVSGMLEAGMANAQIKDTSAEEAAIQNVTDTQFVGGSYDSLLNQFEATNMSRNNFTRQEVRGVTDGQMAGNTLKGVASGAMAGAKVGGIWGAIGGAALGLGSGIAGIAVGNKKAREKSKALNTEAELANNTYMNNFSNSVENMQNTMFNNSLLNIAAHGGKIYIKPSKRGTFTAAAKQRGLGVQEFASKVLANKENYSSSMVKKANFAKNASKWHHAYGGPLYNLTGDFTNGLTFIDAGGTHEQNPFGGVQVGVDYEGTPNLVEEGEIIYNDYVFSNRLKPTKKQLADGGFKDKYNGYTFAKLVEDISKPYMDTPNDPITKVGLDDMMNRIMTMQEEVRAKKNISNTNKFEEGGNFNWGSLGRYAPIVADAAGLITNIFTKPDYTNAEAGVKAMRETPMIDTKPVGDYLQLDRIDRNYLLNPLMANARNSARAIQNQGLNAGQTQAALLSNQYNLNKGIGQTLMEVDRENMNRAIQEAQFNLGINQYNANQAMQVQQMNQQRAYNIAQAEAQAAQMREAIDAQRTAAINQNISGLTEGLSGIGTEAEQKEWLQGLIDSGALQDYRKSRNITKNGGKLLTKKRK